MEEIRVTVPSYGMQVEGMFTKLVKRFEYYGATILQKRLNEGIDYLNLKPVYQIIFMDAYGKVKNKLVTKFQMREEEGYIENDEPLIRRYYIHLPVINNIMESKKVEELNAFEQMCYLFKNDADGDIIKTKERVVKKLMEKHEGMQNNKQIWTLAEQVQIAQTQQQALEQEYFDNGVKLGEGNGYRKMLSQLIMKKYSQDASIWLSTLTSEQLENAVSKILECSTLEELIN